MRRTSLPGLLLLLLSVSAPAADPPRPNLLVILADDLGYSDLGCYGGEIRTPNLDGLAANGLRFTQFYNTARCWPSRAALLSGYYAQQVRRDALPDVPGGTGGVRPRWARLLPDFLRPLGYCSYHSGKWHVDGPVLAGGFDRSTSINHGGYFDDRNTDVDDRPQPAHRGMTGHYATDAIAAAAVAQLQDHAATHPGRPFFSYVAFTAPHFPLHAPPEDIARYRDRYLDGWEKLRAGRLARQRDMGLVRTEISKPEEDVGPPYHFPKDLEILGPGEVNRPLPWDSLTPEQRRFQATKMAIHAAMVDRMDRQIGRILDQLRAMGALENTLILFASDNGASAEIMVRGDGHDPNADPGSALTHLCLGPGFSSAANTPFRRHKTWVHEGGISTPLIVHWPAGIKAKGALRHTPAHLIDVVPTVLDLLDAEKPTTWEGTPIPPAPGRSLAPALAADVPIARDSLWWLHEGNRAIRVGDWKLVAAKGDPWALYDLAADRAEQTDLSATRPDRARDLASRWQAQADAFAALLAKEPPPPARPKAQRKARAKARP
jgi:arylsulfatase